MKVYTADIINKEFVSVSLDEILFIFRVYSVPSFSLSPSFSFVLSKPYSANCSCLHVLPLCASFQSGAD